MKTLFISCLTACSILLACNRSSTKDQLAAGKEEPLTDSAPLGASQTAQDSLMIKLGIETNRIPVSAGESVGTLKLKTPSDTLFTLLGKADSTAADMCKDLSAWQPEKARLRVYSLCDNDFDMRKSMQVIGLGGAPFSTGAGLNEESTFAELRQAYPGLEIVGSYSSGGEILFVADDVEKGISFELSDTSAGTRASAVLVHLPGKPITTTTIPLYPGLITILEQ